jgi:hypothetical protein
MTKEEKKEFAFELLSTPRGYYIMSQALEYAIDTLKKVPEPRREVSNIEDMEVLRETLFCMPVF